MNTESWIRRGNRGPARVVASGWAAALLAFGTPALADEGAAPAADDGFGQETLISSGNVDHGGYGAPVVKVTSFAGDAAILTCARGGWIIGHRVVLGGGGCGKATSTDFEQSSPGDDQSVELGYGGVMLSYVVAPERLLHAEVTLLVGAGGLTAAHRHSGDQPDGPRDAIFVSELELNGMLNVTRWFRLGLGVGYRLAADVDFPGYDVSDVSGPSAALIAKFGSF